ncbi:hypothetical protein BLNAU_22468 [Blattamonas nauphoetae]|uniref:Uncharacterized protein n=1 Tax=Blattamonas nauphoetae TaxID=2049346 RepID=A0ABQ9WSZ2_9EUKA|nr:hypothetical protein BLNAU_22468 [Blattamonas nauphoetae]
MTHRIHLSRLTPTQFSGLSSDVGNALIAGADEQIPGSPPFVQKWVALLGSSFSTRLSLTCLSNIIVVPEPNHKQPTTIEETKQLKMTLLVCMGTTLHGISSVLKKIVAQLIPAVRKRAQILKR